MRLTLWTLALLLGSPAGATESLETTLVKVVARVRPAVAHVEVTQGLSWAPGLADLLKALEVDQPGLDEEVLRATGSAVIVSSDGRVLTNHHVVAGATEVVLVLDDQRRYVARVVGSDPRTDVAVLRIDGPGPFPWVPLGDSRAVRVGKPVLAVGSPFDFQSTVTLGIVSATGRRGLDAREVQDYIQTDAAVNPGNSGGPLFSLDGEVIGINTAIYSQGADQNSGISFAIPSNMARRIADELEADGRVRRARIGIEADDAEAVGGDPSQRGAVVSWVVPGSPALRSGLRRGDVVVAVDDEPVPTAAALRDLVRSREIGSTLKVRVVRGEVQETLSVQVAADVDVGVGVDLELDAADAITWAGALLVEDPPPLRAALGVSEGQGALIGQVEPGSPAALMGLMAGDRLVAINGRSIAHLADLRRHLDAVRVAAVMVGLTRAGQTIITVLPPR